MPLIFSPEAASDTAEIADYYEVQSKGLGLRFMAALGATLDSIESHPLFYRKFLRENRRVFIAGFPYQEVYLHDGATSFILAVGHHKRGPKYWRERLR